MAENSLLQDLNHSGEHQQLPPEVGSQPEPGPSSQALNGQVTSLPSSGADAPNGIPSSDASKQPSSSQSASANISTSGAQTTKAVTSDKMDATEGSSARETEKDRASTSTHTHARTQSTRQKATDKSNSELAHTTSTAVTGTESEQPKGKKAKRVKPKKKTGGPSLISKLLHTLVPCFGPPPRPYVAGVNGSGEKAKPPKPEVQAPTQAQAQTEPSSSVVVPPSSETQEKPPASVAPESKEPSAAPEEKSSSSREIPIPPPLQPVDIPPPSDDPAVVVPPTPTKTLPPEETAGLTSGAVQPPGSTGSSKRDSLHEAHRQGDSENDSDASTSFTDEEEGDASPMEDPEDEEERLIANGGAGIPIGPDGVPRPLLPPLSAKQAGRKCLVLDLDETLVHSSFKSIQQADYVVPVEIEYHWHNVYVIKRPGVDNFLKKMGEIYEIVVFTASLSKYADPVLDKLDIHRVVSHRLFRESCYNHRGNYVKDLSQLGRPIADTIIIDNSPASYIFHPNNAVPVSSWFNDPHDTELTDLVPFLTDLAQVDDVRGVLDGGL